jgi:TfoX/Sxy family transcriptional regulator of competence genes
VSFDADAAERVRRVLSGRVEVVEARMVGGLSFLVNGNMCCGITGTELMIRVGANSREKALRAARPADGFRRAGLVGLYLHRAGRLCG